MRSALSLVTLPYDMARELGEMATAGLFGWTCGLAGVSASPRRAEPGQGEGRRTPVVLVHGYGGSGYNWSPLEDRLRRVGFLGLRVMRYDPFAAGVAEIARAVVRECRDAIESAGTDRVHLVGHSLGGVVVRYAVQELGLEACVGTAITVATPHCGTPVALFGWGDLAAALRPGSRVLEDLHRGSRASTVRWVSFYSDRDLVVRPDSSRLSAEALRATNILVPGAGHLGILRAPLFLASVVRLLSDDSDLPGQSAASPTVGEVPGLPPVGQLPDTHTAA